MAIPTEEQGGAQSEAGRQSGQVRTLPAPSGRKLAKATALALVVAAVVLVTAVLPAEYGIDPLGTGRALGLTNLFAAEEVAAPETITPDEAGPVHPQLNEYRVDTREFTLPPRAGMEFKYQLARGATILYSWKSNAFIDFDFHTEPAGKPPEASDSFEKGNAAQSRGAYTAPYAGIHGWYWENPTDREVTITLTSAGFYTSAMLFMPGQPPQKVDIGERP